VVKVGWVQSKPPVHARCRSVAQPQAVGGNCCAGIEARDWMPDQIRQNGV
jgi:hypothetical protein